jgi:hypothetical protein
MAHTITNAMHKSMMDAKKPPTMNALRIIFLQFLVDGLAAVVHIARYAVGTFTLRCALSEVFEVDPCLFA